MKFTHFVSILALIISTSAMAAPGHLVVNEWLKGSVGESAENQARCRSVRRSKVPALVGAGPPRKHHRQPRPGRGHKGKQAEWTTPCSATVTVSRKASRAG